MGSTDDPTWLADTIVAAASDAGIGIAVTALAPEMRNVFATEAMASLFGYELRDFLGLNPLDLFEGDDLARMSEMAEAVADGGGFPPLVRATARHRTGCPVSFDATLAPTEVDGLPAVASFAVDASRRRTAEQSLAASESQLLDVLDRLPDPVFATRGGRVVYANGAIRELLGLPMDQPRELLGDDSRGSRLEPPSELRPDRVELVLSSASGREVTLEARAMRAEFRRSPVDLWFCRDVTEHRELEARLMQADRLATLGTLAGGLAHAINNPLSSMLLNLEDLVRRMPQLSERPELSESVQGRLAMAKEAADRVAGVVAQLRIFSRMRMSDAIDDVDVRRVVEDGIELVANEIRHRGQLELALRPVPMVRGIEGRIEQALLTLLIFAVRLLPDRPGGPSRLVIETGLGGGHVEVMVRCEGAPLPAEGLQTLSDPFAGSGTRDRGLGLAICGDIVRSMGGELVIRGSADASSFCVRLPAPARDAGAEAQVEPSRGHDADARGRRARVLAIDDDPGVLSALRLMLQDDHDVTVLQSAGEAVKEIVGGASYDVVFCDFVMPEMTGEDVYEAVRRDRPGFERRIVFMTGAAFQRDAEAFLARVANDRVDKPFNLERVEALVRRAVE